MADYAFKKLASVRMLSVSGALAQPECQRFRAELRRASAPSSDAPVIVDLSATSRIGSAGMRLLVQCQRELEKRGSRMMTVGLTGFARETVELCGIDTLLKTAANVDDAIGTLAAHDNSIIATPGRTAHGH